MNSSSSQPSQSFNRSRRDAKVSIISSAIGGCFIEPNNNCRFQNKEELQSLPPVNLLNIVEDQLSSIDSTPSQPIRYRTCTNKELQMLHRSLQRLKKNANAIQIDSIPIQPNREYTPTTEELHQVSKDLLTKTNGTKYLDNIPTQPSRDRTPTTKELQQLHADMQFEETNESSDTVPIQPKRNLTLTKQETQSLRIGNLKKRKIITQKPMFLLELFRE